MSTVLEHVTALETAKSEMLEIFQDRGVTVPEGTSLVNFPEYMEQMSGGGIPCALTIMTSPGATVTATFGDTVITAVANDDGAAKLVLEKEGIWRIVASDGQTEKTIDIDVVFEMTDYLSLARTLEEMSWAEISAISKSGEASTLWKIGDTKTLYINGVGYPARIIGFDHDDVTDSASYGRTKAGITFQLVDCYGSKSGMGGESGGWAASSMKTTTLRNILGFCGADFRNAVVTVNKPYWFGGYHQSEFGFYEPDSVALSEDNLFLLSENEIFGTTTQGLIAEGVQYEFYSAGKSKVKRIDGTAVAWWTRTLSNNGRGTKYWVNVTTSGGLSSDLHTTSHSIAPAFCI